MFDSLPSPRLRSVEHRLVGRVVEFEDRFHLVTDVDTRSGFASLACDVDGKKRKLSMTIPEVLWWLQLASAKRQASEIAALTTVTRI